MDGQLIQRLWERDESVLTTIKEYYGLLLYTMAFRVLGSKEDAEECVSDVWLELWDAIPPQRPASLKAFACTMVKRRAVDRLRKNTAQKRGGKVYVLALEELSECVGESVCEEGDIAHAIQAFLLTLSAEDRRIFLARYYGLETVKAIARQRRISANAVSVRLTRMRQALREQLTKEGIAL